MKRREALQGLAGLALGAPFTALAQRTRKPYRIGTLTAAWAFNHPAVEGLQAGLVALGFIEGRDVVFEHRFVEGRLEELPAAAHALLAQRCDVLFTVSESATRAAAAATTSLPIVFANVSDPVASGLVRELSHPGGNVTGVSNLSIELAPKRVEMLKAVAPGLRRLWVIYEADGRREILQSARRMGEAARALGIEMLERAVRTPQEVSAALAEVKRGDGLMPIESGGQELNIGALMIETAAQVKALTMFSSAFWLEHGALVS